MVVSLSEITHRTHLFTEELLPDRQIAVRFDKLFRRSPLILFILLPAKSSVVRVVGTGQHIGTHFLNNIWRYPTIFRLSRFGKRRSSNWGWSVLRRAELHGVLEGHRLRAPFSGRCCLLEGARDRLQRGCRGRRDR